MSNFESYFNGIATILTGVVAWFVYIRQKYDNKRSAASIIHLEISQAEDALKEIKKFNSVSHLTSVMPTNSWIKYQHLFIDNFNDKQRSDITAFYTSCTVIEQALIRVNNNIPSTNYEKMRLYQEETLRVARDHPKTPLSSALENKAFEDKLRPILTRFSEDADFYIPNFEKSVIFPLISTMPGLINSPTGEKLKKLSLTFMQRRFNRKTFI